jgi:hypothetical protein
MLTATTTADSQAHYALAPDLVAAPRQNNRHLPRPVKRFALNFASGFLRIFDICNPF